jgi:hypothetical protein
LLRVLIERRGDYEAVPTRVTDEAISSARESDGTTRHTAWRMRGWIDSSFAQAGKELAEDVKRSGLVRAVRKKGWMLTVRGSVT